MRILFLGGGGAMAAAMIELMRGEAAIEQVTLADRDEAAASMRAAAGGPKFSAMRLDLTDRGALVKAMGRHDIALNYAGPFYRFEQPTAEAAIEAGIPYISIADDYDAYLGAATLEDPARAAGVKIMTGFGNSPGLTQLLAKKGYLSVEKPRRIAVNWAAGSNEEVGASNILHVLHLMSGQTLQWRDGHEQYVPCGKGRKMVEFPEPLGHIPTWYTGHAESVTLPRWLPGLEEVSVHGGVVPPFDFEIVAFFAKLGLTKTHARRERLYRIMKPFLPLFQSKSAPDVSAGRVEVHGEGGAQACYTFLGHIAFITSCPCLQAVLHWGQGAFDALPGGVYPPERLIADPGPFIDELVARGMDIRTEA